MERNDSLKRLCPPTGAGGEISRSLTKWVDVKRGACGLHHRRQLPSVQLSNSLQRIEPLNSMGIAEQNDIDIGGCVSKLAHINLCRLQTAHTFIPGQPCDITDRRSDCLHSGLLL